MNDEIKENVNAARNEFDAVRLLHENGFYRTAIARLYYVCFYYIRAILLSKEMVFRSHRSVIAKFGEHFVNSGIFPASSGRLIRTLFEFRQVMAEILDAVFIPDLAWFNSGVEIATAILGDIDHRVAIFITVTSQQLPHPLRIGLRS